LIPDPEASRHGYARIVDEAGEDYGLIRACLERELAVSAYLIREYWLDVGRHDDLRKADRDVAEGLLD
jgi:NDP-sugar pyrophosphorylase family protein